MKEQKGEIDMAEFINEEVMVLEAEDFVIDETTPTKATTTTTPVPKIPTATPVAVPAS